MKKIIITLCSLVLTFFTLLMYINIFSLSVNAQTATGGTANADINFKIPNPTKYQNLEDVINAATSVARVVFILTFGGVILYGGFMRLTSEGVPEKIEKSSKIIMAGIVGFAIIVFAQPITEFVARLLGVQGGLFKPGP